MLREQKQELRPVLLRALNKNQVLILSKAKGAANITYLLESIAKESKIPLSTLKLNAKILRSLKLIEFNGSPVRITSAGKFVLDIIEGGMLAKE